MFPVDAPPPAAPGDDGWFIEIVHRVIAGELDAKPVEELFIVRIDNWFDHKWRNFSGRDLGAISVWQGGAATTFPPFSPNRVIAQHHYGERPGEVLIHPKERRPSRDNLNRRILDAYRSALFVWFSSNTSANRRGSLMVYRAENADVSSWYCSLKLDRVWQIHQTAGTPPRAYFTTDFSTA
jgi:hypothetical protein